MFLGNSKRPSETPCCGCESRHQACHSTCKLYLEYRESIDNLKKARDVPDTLDMLDAYRHKRYYKVRQKERKLMMYNA